MDVSNLLLSGAVSAIVGTFVSLLTVSQVTVGKMRAERAETARRTIREHLRQPSMDLADFALGDTLKLEREPTRAHLEDMETAAVLLAAAKDLRWWPGQVFRRRAHRVYGRHFCYLAERHDSPGARTITALVPRMMREQGRWRPSSKRAMHITDGLWHRALSSDRQSLLVRRLRIELFMLKSCGWI